jgi:RimJ/RimL family protein N-acetyltransferase
VPSPYTKDDAFAWVALAESMGREGSAYHMLVTAATDGAPLGAVGLEVHQSPELYGEPHGEIGYWIAAPARGRGIATRAVRLLAAWALEEVALPVLEIHVLPGNGPSHAVARKAGFKRAGERLLPFRGSVEEFHVYVLRARSTDASGAVAGDRPVASSTPAKTR